MKFKNIESPVIQSYRQILGVKPTSTPEDIKKAFRNLAQVYHPDKNKASDANSQFSKLQEAYEVLSDSDKISHANEEFMRTKLFGQCVEGVNITFGTFFGYRRYEYERVEREKRIGIENAHETDEAIGYYDFSKADDSRSILDSSAFDSIELVFAGKFSGEDDSRIKQGFKGKQVAQLPWIVANNRGIIEFLNGEFEKACKTFDELNRRVPRNIIFLYRLAICHILLGFKNKKKTLFGKQVPAPSHIKIAMECLRKGIAIGESRSIGKQKCLVIRKTLAELYEAVGQKSKAKKVWSQILELSPKSFEAKDKLQIAYERPRLRSSL